MNQELLQIADKLKDIACEWQMPKNGGDACYGRMRLEPFELDSFGGFVASYSKGVFVVFRGSCLTAENPELFERTLKNWLTNLRFVQTERYGYRVHKGFHDELLPSTQKIKTIAMDFGGDRSPIYLAGHSAGAAIATLCGRILHEEGVGVKEVFAFSSPRVGDRRFSETYPIALTRIEHRYDIIPHVPFSPFLARMGDELVECFRDAIEEWLNISADKITSRNVEYVHAGELY